MLINKLHIPALPAAEPCSKKLIRIKIKEIKPKYKQRKRHLYHKLVFFFFRKKECWLVELFEPSVDFSKQFV